MCDICNIDQSSGAAYLTAQRVARRLARPELDCPDVEFDATAFDRPESDGEGAPDNGTDTSEAPVSDGGDYDDCPLVVTVFPDSGERYLSAGVFDAPDAE